MNPNYKVIAGSYMYGERKISLISWQFVSGKTPWADIKDKSSLPDEPDHATIERVVFDILTERFK